MAVISARKQPDSDQSCAVPNAFINRPVEVPAVRRQFATYLGIGGRRPDLVMRFGYSPELPKSLRRPVERVILPA
jgi:hypothetical protein